MAIDDLANPVLLLHLRQAVRAREFNLVFFGLLLGGFILSLIAVQFPRPAWTISLTISIALSGLFPVILPLSLVHAATTERNSRAHELVLISPLSAGKIVLGKYWSSLVTGMICASALAPYLALAYFLGGVDLYAILFPVVGSAAAGTLLAALALAAAEGVANKLAQRAGLALVVCAGLFASSSLVATFGQHAWPFSSRVPGPHLIAVPAFLFAASIPLTATLLLVARSRFLPPESDRVRAVRIASLASLAEFAGLFWALRPWRISAARPGAGPLSAIDPILSGIADDVLGWFAVAVLAASALAFFALTGESAASRRVLRSLAQSPAARIVAIIAGPGAHRAIVHSILAFAIVAAAIAPAAEISGLAGTRGSTPPEVRLAYIAFAALAYTAFFTGLPIAVLEGLKWKRPASPAARRVAALAFLTFVATATSVLLAARPEWDLEPALTIYNPFVTVGNALWSGRHGALNPWIALIAAAAAVSWVTVAVRSARAERAILRALEEGSHAA